MNELTVSNTVALPSDALGMMRFAEVLSKAAMLPKHFRNPPDLCMGLMALQELGVKNPVLALHEVGLISGRPDFSGKLMLGIANTSPLFAERLRFEFTGQGDERAITVIGRLVGEQDTRSLTLRLKDARTGNEQWKKQPDQQLVYRGTIHWMRRFTPELALGITTEKEMIDVTPAAHTPTLPGRIDPALSQEKREELVDAQTLDNVGRTVSEQNEAGEIFEIERKDDSAESWKSWWGSLMAHIRAARTADEINDWINANSDQLAALQRLDAEKYRKLSDDITKEMKHRE